MYNSRAETSIHVHGEVFDAVVGMVMPDCIAASAQMFLLLPSLLPPFGTTILKPDLLYKEDLVSLAGLLKITSTYPKGVRLC